MPSQYHSAGLCRNHLFTLEIISSPSSDFFPWIASFKGLKYLVVGRSQIRVVSWMRQDSPLKNFDGLSGMQTCVWPRIIVVKKHFCDIFIGTNPPGKLLQSFHIDVRVDRLASGQHVYESSQYEKTVAMILLAEGIVLLFFL
jgi:hypothetical protein